MTNKQLLCGIVGSFLGTCLAALVASQPDFPDSFSAGFFTGLGLSMLGFLIGINFIGE